MFDDIHPEPEDMFDETDKVAPQLNPPTAPSIGVSSQGSASGVANPPSSSDGSLSMGELSEPKKTGPWKAVLLIVGIVVVVAGALFLSMKILSSKTDVVPEPPVVTDIQTQPPVSDTAPTQEQPDQQEPVITKEPEKTSSRVDTDKDGLTDEEETELGTSSKTADTDSDGLFDFEEVKTWGTDPVNPDTDADGYLDGAEVKAGYNPNGQGSLREAPSESS
ncbi:hypothetical protein HYV70_05200 [Candidatus Uhrbacteria bacterium]|nr:hypothetical protein [Candidatus Uhrbacteria bacterium]